MRLAPRSRNGVVKERHGAVRWVILPASRRRRSRRRKRRRKRRKTPQGKLTENSRAFLKGNFRANEGQLRTHHVNFAPPRFRFGISFFPIGCVLPAHLFFCGRRVSAALTLLSRCRFPATHLFLPPLRSLPPAGDLLCAGRTKKFRTNSHAPR